MDQYEREEDALLEQLNNGEITQKEFHAAMRELRDDVRMEAEMAAEEAYDAVVGRY